MGYAVTIASTTYNLEQYIAQAIDSWLAQKVTFPYEILISDDGSTDRTLEIIESYMINHPNIRLIRNDHKGMMPNFVKSLEESTGKYIALCDGDDYWIDDDKLQKQYDFMETHPDFSACFTNSWVVSDNTGERRVAKTQLWDTADSAELLMHRDNDNIQMSPGHTSSYFFRNGLIKKYPEWMYGDIMTDFPLYMLISKYGKAKFLNEMCTVYRAGRVNSDSNLNWTNEKSWCQRIYAYQCVNKELDYNYKKIINPIIASYYFKLCKLFWKTGRKKASLRCGMQSLLSDWRGTLKWITKKYKSFSVSILKETMRKLKKV